MIIEQNLCDFKHARHDLKEVAETTQEFCVPLWNRSDASHRGLEKRIFRTNHRATQPTSAGSTEINTGALFQRILETDDIPFLYSRITRYRHLERLPPVGNRPGAPLLDANNQPVQTEQVNLEGTYVMRMFIIMQRLIRQPHTVVYDLRNARDLQQRPGIDIFAVFHFHIDNMSYDPDDETGEELMYPAVRMAHVFHAQQVYNANLLDPDNPREWRVDFGLPPRAIGMNPTERTLVYDCPPPPQDEMPRYWYPGDGGTRAAQALNQRFGVMLRDRGTNCIRLGTYLSTY